MNVLASPNGAGLQEVGLARFCFPHRLFFLSSACEVFLCASSGFLNSFSLAVPHYMCLPASLPASLTLPGSCDRWQTHRYLCGFVSGRRGSARPERKGRLLQREGLIGDEERKVKRR
mmetsp:Transcript_52005/g.101843  ORF Transcript_52005/g.101843 Transcript_52005/m.101843 type:complete len:117 (+) Transcript_52005:22-372(+)